MITVCECHILKTQNDLWPVACERPWADTGYHFIRCTPSIKVPVFDYSAENAQVAWALFLLAGAFQELSKTGTFPPGPYSVTVADSGLSKLGNGLHAEQNGVGPGHWSAALHLCTPLKSIWWPHMLPLLKQRSGSKEDWLSHRNKLCNNLRCQNAKDTTCLRFLHQPPKI